MRTDGQTDMSKLVVAVANFTNAHKEENNYKAGYMYTRSVLIMHRNPLNKAQIIFL
jgi:hypothetical protein